MARGIFGGRREPRHREQTGEWPQLPGASENGAAHGLDLPAVTYAVAAIAPGEPNVASTSPETDLLERIAGFRDAVADALFDASQDYQILCNLAHEGLDACDEAIEELRRRLTGNLHYTVLAKLDEMYALVASHIAESAPSSR